MSRRWSTFGRLVAPGKVHHYSRFSAFVYNGSHCGSVESQSLETGSVTLSRLIDVNDFGIYQPWRFVVVHLNNLSAGHEIHNERLPSACRLLHEINKLS